MGMTDMAANAAIKRAEYNHMADKVVRCPMRFSGTFALWLLAALLLAAIATPTSSYAFGEETAFAPRFLVAGGSTLPYPEMANVWNAQVASRTSAPTRSKNLSVRADDPSLLRGTFVYWSNKEAVKSLSSSEIAGLSKFLAMGGLLVVEDPEHSDKSAFTKSVRRELARVLPEALEVPLPAEHVLNRSFYQLKKYDGREVIPPKVSAMLKNGHLQVLFVQEPFGPLLERRGVSEDDGASREKAIRLAVNIAMYTLCLDYKDDQVHATSLMRRRSRLGDSLLRPAP
jgi:Domain of unknown function (DUF4159)